MVANLSRTHKKNWEDPEFRKASLRRLAMAHKNHHGFRNHPLYYRANGIIQRTKKNPYSLAEEFRNIKILIEYLESLDRPKGHDILTRIDLSLPWQRGNIYWKSGNVGTR